MPDGTSTLPEDRERPLTEHLGELRHRLIRAALVVMGITFAAFAVNEQILQLLVSPLDFQPHTFTLQEAFLLRIQVSLAAAIVVSLPYLLWETWGFMRPGLYPHERRWVGGGLFWGGVLMYLGLAFGLLVLVPISVRALEAFTGNSLQLTLRAQAYFTFLFWVEVTSVAIFELPLIFVILTRIGLLNPDQVARNRRSVLLTLVTVLAIITPSVDAVSLLLVAGPVWLLLEISLWVARRVRPKPEGEGERTDA